MKIQKSFFLLVFIGVGCSAPSTENTSKPDAKNTTALTEAGKQIFYAKCVSCHNVNKELTGPALKGVESRWPDKQKLYSFIRNSQEVIKSDKYAHDLWMKYNQTIMNTHPDMTDEQIRSVLDYINSVSE